MLVLNLQASKTRKYAAQDRFHGNGLYGKNPTKGKNQSERSDLKLPCHIINRINIFVVFWVQELKYFILFWFPFFTKNKTLVQMAKSAVVTTAKVAGDRTAVC